MVITQHAVYLPDMFLIGSAGRNSGKTTLGRSMIEIVKDELPVYALKIITITGKKGVCQRGGTGCGICTSISSGFELIEETRRIGQKDTALLLQAGAEKSYLLKCMADSLTEGLNAFLSVIPQGSRLIVCESNSLRQVVKPGVFAFVANTPVSKMKPSAKAVYEKADWLIDDVAAIADWPITFTTVGNHTMISCCESNRELNAKRRVGNE